MMNNPKTEKTVIFFVASTLFAFFCATQEATSEEIVPSIPLETLSPEAFPPVSSVIPESRVSLKEKTPPLDEITTFDETGSIYLPDGREVALKFLQGKFTVGERATSLIYHPKATLSFRACGGVKNYMGQTPPEEIWQLLTEEEKVGQGFRFAESITKTIQSLPIPMLGDFLAHCLKVGRKVESFDKRIKHKYHLHLRYSENTFQAAYKDSF